MLRASFLSSIPACPVSIPHLPGHASILLCAPPQLRMMGSPIVEVRVQGCWSLRNLAYKSNEAFKQQLLEVREGGREERCGIWGGGEVQG